MSIRYIHIVFLFSCAVVTNPSMSMNEQKKVSSSTSSATSMDMSSNSSSSSSALPPLPDDADDLAASLGSLSTQSSFAPLTGRPNTLTITEEPVGTIDIIQSPLQIEIQKGQFAQALTRLNNMSKAQIAGEYISSLLHAAKSTKTKGSSALQEQRTNLITKLTSLADSPPSSPTSGAEGESKRTKGGKSKTWSQQEPKALIYFFGEIKAY